MFLSIGKILEGSGVPIVFSKQRSLLVVPSTNFYGENHTVSRSGNLLIATAMHDLHPERFVEEMNIASTNLLQELEN